METIVNWEKVYAVQIEQLKNRVLQLKEGDFMRRSYLGHQHVAQRLEVQESSWNNAANEWLSSDEETGFKLIDQLTLASADNLGVPSDSELTLEGGRDKSLFISLLPKDDRLLSVVPIIPVHEGDFLGVFAGTIRFSERFNNTHGICGPAENLWLDYSQVTGILNLMRVSEPGGDANVCLQWEFVNEQDGTQLSMSWRVSVRAVRTIMPFKELIRAAPQKEQYLLHRSPVYAKRGFLKNGKS